MLRKPNTRGKVQIPTDNTVADIKYSDANGIVTTSVLEEGYYDVIISKDGYHPVHYSRQTGPYIFLTLIDLQLTPTNISAASAKYISQSTDSSTEGNLLWTCITNGGSINMDFDSRIIMPQNTKIVARAKNNDNQEGDVAFSISWCES